MLAILVGAGLLVLDLIFTVVTTEGEQFARKLPSMLESIQAQVAASDLPASVKDTVANLGPALRDWIAHLNWGQIVATGLSGVFGLAGTLLELTVIPFFVFFVAKDLHKLISHVAFATSTEESRPILNGVLWDSDRLHRLVTRRRAPSPSASRSTP